VKSDGRPIFGFSAKDLVKVVLDIEPECLLVPAHVWTPWFSVFGSQSGFASLEECFEEETAQLFAIETGLSSDPAMNWRWSALDNLALISNSDAHSPAKIGREANIFETELSYPAIREAIKQRDPARFPATIEFFPEEGKYHYDGHRGCQVCFSPGQSRENEHCCPVCGKKIVIGVMHRVEELADRPPGFRPPGANSAIHLVPLEEIIAAGYGLGAGAKRVRREYLNLLERGGSELEILLDKSAAELTSFMDPRLVEGILRVRQGQVILEPGYDGVYGRVNLYSKNPSKTQTPSPLLERQLDLF
jgi:uncharacterized protein (TIGR00375 family)